MDSDDDISINLFSLPSSSSSDEFYDQVEDAVNGSVYQQEQERRPVQDSTSAVGEEYTGEQQQHQSTQRQCTTSRDTKIYDKKRTKRMGATKPQDLHRSHGNSGHRSKRRNKENATNGTIRKYDPRCDPSTEWSPSSLTRVLVYGLGYTTADTIRYSIYGYKLALVLTGLLFVNEFFSVSIKYVKKALYHEGCTTHAADIMRRTERLVIIVRLFVMTALAYATNGLMQRIFYYSDYIGIVVVLIVIIIISMIETNILP